MDMVLKVGSGENSHGVEFIIFLYVQIGFFNVWRSLFIVYNSGLTVFRIQMVAPENYGKQKGKREVVYWIRLLQGRRRRGWKGYDCV
jgi:hypothetical protein